MNKKEWRRSLAYVYDEQVGPYLSGWRLRRYPPDYAEERYLLDELADAVDVMRFADRHANAIEPATLHAEVRTITNAGRRVRLSGSSWNFDGDPTGMVMVRR